MTQTNENTQKEIYAGTALSLSTLNNPIITPGVDKNTTKNKPIEEKNEFSIITPSVDKCPICNNPINNSKESINHNGNLYLSVCSKKCRDMPYTLLTKEAKERLTLC